MLPYAFNVGVNLMGLLVFALLFGAFCWCCGWCERNVDQAGWRGWVVWAFVILILLFTLGGNVES